MLKLSKLRRCHEASAFISAAASHLFLSEVHIAHDRAFMPFYPHLFAICGGGHQETRTFQGVLSGSQAHSALPSLGRFRIWSRSMNIPVDIHTHRLPQVPGTAIANCYPETFSPQSGGWYSVGIHPWHIGRSGGEHSGVEGTYTLAVSAWISLVRFIFEIYDEDLYFYCV